VVICIDAEETTHGWDISTSRHKVWRRRRWHKANKTPVEVYEKFFFGSRHKGLPEEPVDIDVS
jgi:hypothetical protein